MADSGHRRHDISDRVWQLLEPRLPGREGAWGGKAHDNRRFINAVFWILRTGAPWRDLPPDYGDWKNTHRRFCRWRDKGIWESLLEQLVIEPDYEWLMIDASHIKVHPHAAGAKGGSQDMGVTKGGFNSKIHLAVDAHGMPLRVIVTAGTVADCTQASTLIAGLDAQHLLADKGYDTDAIVAQAQAAHMAVVIPPKKNRTELRAYDQDLYRLRHLVENAFLHLKRWRGIATRYAKNTASFLAAVQIRCIAIWAAIL
ncbi:IS5 family transposase [Methylococcus sp. EFPC2]|uniref:IS5 family transposase n=1 Tax=Methylococcus sp. EFPC2 TaxID=2812648 RepID=UPI0019688029|nr:IS5 family transposase [Methylococcus sp. EFPC2]QSA98979.1 IS5 family transposase [Methylococcus sp. EFPC2]